MAKWLHDILVQVLLLFWSAAGCGAPPPPGLLPSFFVPLFVFSGALPYPKRAKNWPISAELWKSTGS